MPSKPHLSRRASQATGQPISFLMEQALAHPHLISLAAGFVDQETLPVEATRQAFEALWSDPAQARAALQYGTTPGDPALRERLLADLIAADGPASANQALTIEQLILTAGSNELLHQVADTLFDPGDIVLTTSPSYFVFLGLCDQKGNVNFGSPNFNQRLVATMLDQGTFWPHLERLRAEYRVKLAAMLTACEESCEKIRLGIAALARAIRAAEETLPIGDKTERGA